MTLRRLRFLESIAQIDARSWNALAGASQPFLRHEFLSALEQSGCAAPRSGWAPKHALLEDANGVALAAMPLFRKCHSRGEFVFDFAWAGAYAEHGLKYYPKLLTAVPFTPVSGPRVLLRSQVNAAATTRTLISGVLEYAQDERLSSWHVLFPSEDTAATLSMSCAGIVAPIRLKKSRFK